MGGSAKPINKAKAVGLNAYNQNEDLYSVYDSFTKKQQQSKVCTQCKYLPISNIKYLCYRNLC